MLKLSTFLFGILCLICFPVGRVSAQISEGGFPLDVPREKSLTFDRVVLPRLSESEIDSLIHLSEQNAGQLKALQFARAFHVDLSPSNSGMWYSGHPLYNVWQLNLVSAGAKSLSLVFNDFELPKGARLFVFNRDSAHYLGAFTSANNKAWKKFSVLPVLGEELTLQYEVPKNLGTPSSFSVVQVNHDYLGILKSNRRPLGIAAGECNVDINCEIGEKYHQLKNAVCRLIVPTANGSEVCSGTLVNNTAEDRKAYIISAGHCYDKWEYAETALYTFNYESPYCAPLDGDPGNSISGAEMKAHDEKLDFALVEMSIVPPPTYRPYYAGWDHSGLLPDSTVSIHHPQGDVKKIAFDNDPPTRSNFNSNYVSGAFLRIAEWDEGVTEDGSSGGPLFNTSQQLIGTLTGGVADCIDPVNDYYANFSIYWDYRSDTAKQVKYWLDPINSGNPVLKGKQFNEGDDLCAAFTNLTDDDEHAVVELTTGGTFAGYWGGTNSVNITDIVERFNISGNESLLGVSIGVGKIVRKSSGSSSITVKVYEGDATPQSLLYSKTVQLGSLARDAMNYISFDENIEPVGDFFVGFSVDKVDQKDTLAIYQSLRENGGENKMFYKRDGDWFDFESNGQGAMVNVMELIACNYDGLSTDTPNIEGPRVWMYPNPTASSLTITSDQTIAVETVSVFNLIGQEINPPLLGVEDNRIEIDLSGCAPGTYLVRFNYDDGFVTRKISFVPY